MHSRDGTRWHVTRRGITVRVRNRVIDLVEQVKAKSTCVITLGRAITERWEFSALVLAEECR